MSPDPSVRFRQTGRFLGALAVWLLPVAAQAQFQTATTINPDEVIGFEITPGGLQGNQEVTNHFSMQGVTFSGGLFQSNDGAPFFIPFSTAHASKPDNFAIPVAASFSTAPRPVIRGGFEVVTNDDAGFDTTRITGFRGGVVLGAEDFATDNDTETINGVEVAQAVVIVQDLNGIDRIEFQAIGSQNNAAPGPFFMDTFMIELASPPTADAGGPYLFDAATLDVTLDGSGSAGSNVPIATYGWTDIDGGQVPGTPTIAATVSLAIEDSGLDSPTDSGLTTLTVTNTAGLAATDTAAISYLNAGPVAEADPDLTFDSTMADRAADGSGSSDDDLAVNARIAGFEALSFDWSNGATGQAPAVSFGDAVLAGMSMTTQTGTISLGVTDRAGASGTDSLGVGYANAAPQVLSAMGTENVDFSITFQALFGDPDLAVNGVFAGFEALGVEISQSAAFGSGFLAGTGTTLGGTLDRAALEGLFGGPGTFTIFANAADKAGEAASASFAITLSETGPPPMGMPEPGTITLMLGGLAGLAVLRRRRATARTG